MNSISVCLLLLCAAEPVASSDSTLYQFSPRLEAAIRGQSPDPAYDPFGAGPVLEAPVPSGADPYNSYGMPPGVQDPFSYGSDPGLYPNPMPQQGPMYAGVVGPQPYRFGYIPRLDMGYIPETGLDDVDSSVEMFELDSELRHNRPFAPGWVLSTAPQFDYRAWNFDGVLSDTYRTNLFRMGYDMELIKLKTNGVTLNFAFNPSINTDFDHNLTSDAWNFDARIAATYQVDQVWMLVFGVQYWDRVDDIIIPHAGVVITPNNLWEFRLLFPKARISRFVGSFWGGHHWLYVSSEYNVEAYQIDLQSIGSSPRNRVQYEDWRLAFGLRSDHGWFDKYIEVAWVVGRNFEFERDLPKTDVGNQVLVRGGIRF